MIAAEGWDAFPGRRRGPCGTLGKPGALQGILKSAKSFSAGIRKSKVAYSYDG